MISQVPPSGGSVPLPTPRRLRQAARLLLFGSLIASLAPQPLQAAPAPNPAALTVPQTPAPPNPNQPYAINRQGLLPPPCPLIVPPQLPALQPIRIQPSQVAIKNRIGCLSAADAYYGPDGCPLRLCPAGSGAMSMPQGN
ncbi:MAG: hypothetical protein VKK62_08125 [Synechococcaceae cyanobacterium]|nr:hypothetical protein [Synechococcaceae cyanobacterium]